MPDVWEADNFGTLLRDGTGDFDGDSFSDLNEYLAGTSPTNALSLLRIKNFSKIAPDGITISWQSVSNRFYDVLMATGNITSAFSPVVTNIVPTPPVNILNLASPASSPVFFRIRTSP
ncbi:MAG: hypothetical protein WDN00_03200 [Limisphaerales bacterium]